MENNNDPFSDIFAPAIAAAQSVQSERTKENNETEQRSIEWFASRLGKFTASGMPDLMSAGRGAKFGSVAVNYVLKLAVERTLSDEGREMYIQQLMSKDFVQTRWGNRYEYEAREEFEKFMGVKTGSVTFRKNKAMPFFGGSADFVANDGIPGEIKCPFDPLVHERNLQLSLKPIPKSHTYYAQIQAHIMNFDSPFAYFVSYDPRRAGDKKIAVITVDRDEQFIAEMTERLQIAERAINMYIQDGVPIEEGLNK